MVNLQVKLCSTVRPSHPMRRSFATKVTPPRTHKKMILSGIQPTGQLHLGNYLGAVSNWVKLQNENTNQMAIMLADMHSLTSRKASGTDVNEIKENNIDGKILATSTLRMTATLIACGIDPAKVILFNQSRVLEHSELYWIFGCLTPMSNLELMTQFKDKKQAGIAANLGLFAYPVLQAADILLYRATEVPIGQDQTQHLELTRKVAGLFNTSYNCNVFPEPKPIYTEFQRVMSLRDGKQKMSKSNPVDATRINLDDSPDLIQQKIRKAKTDGTIGVSNDSQNRPEVTNLVNIYSSVSGMTVEEVCSKFQNSGHGAFKESLSELLVEKFKPVRDKLHQLEKDPKYILDVLHHGSAAARGVATETMSQVRPLVGYV